MSPSRAAAGSGQREALIAAREKDFAFANALIRAGLVKPAVVAERIERVDVHPLVLKRLRDWIAMYLPAA